MSKYNNYLYLKQVNVAVYERVTCILCCRRVTGIVCCLRTLGTIRVYCSERHKLYKSLGTRSIKKEM